MNQRPPAEPDELAAFQAAVDGVVPLRSNDRIAFDRPKPSPRPRQRERDEAAAISETLHAPLEIDDWLDLGDADSFLRPGLPRNVLRDLRRGRWSIQDHLDLHGMNRHEAHEQVTLFLAEAQKADKRCLRIVHGRGHGSPGKEAVLRQLLKGWLGRRNDVLAFCHAPLRDGGDGALWLLLRAASRR